MTEDKKVLISQKTLNFYAGELHEIHALMDAGNVPRELNGEKLSVAQRVRWFYNTREMANAAILKAGRTHTSH